MLPSGMTLAEASLAGRGQGAANELRSDFFALLPVEVTLEVLVRLDEAGLDAASRVCKEWRAVITGSEFVWRHRVRALWPVCSRSKGEAVSWAEVHKLLFKATAIANGRGGVGDALAYLDTFGLCSTEPAAAARFLRQPASLRLISRQAVGRYVLRAAAQDQPTLLRGIMAGQNYTCVLLPDALRLLFSVVSIEGAMTSSRAIAPVFQAFIDRYLDCNPEHRPRRESAHLLCYSLLLLSVDRFNPHVKDKMTRREFSRNNRSVLEAEHYDLGYLDQIYDNVCEWGSVFQPAPRRQPADAIASLAN